MAIWLLLARTTAKRLAHDPVQLSTTVARLESVTWTPQASGSIGPGGPCLAPPDSKALPAAALEADGTLRLWNPNGGATPLSTLRPTQAVGNSACAQGAWRDGQCLGRSAMKACFYSHDLSLLSSGWNGGVHLPCHCRPVQQVTSVAAFGQCDEDKSWQTVSPPHFVGHWASPIP